jgi:hypothetical protein
MLNIKKAFVFLSFFFLSCDSIASDCRVVGNVKRDSMSTIYVDDVGKYCLLADVVQKSVFDIHSGSFKSLEGTPLLIIAYRNSPGSRGENPVGTSFDVDLQGHILKANVNDLTGVAAELGARRIAIRGGRVSVPGESAAIGISLQNDDGSIMVKGEYSNLKRVSGGNPIYEDIPLAELIYGDRPSYRPADNIVTEMNIYSGWRGVVMGGAGNILRNSTIEVGGHTAIYMYGPNAVIENNTIIINGNGERKKFDAAIKLRGAEGAIIRNNRIIYNGIWPRKAPAAINLLDSNAVRIEGNTFIGFDSIVRGNGATKCVENGNVFE